MINALEQAARRAWREWASYMKYTRCSDCERFDRCGARRQRGPWLCVECFDMRPQPRKKKEE